MIILILMTRPAGAREAVSLTAELNGLLGDRRGCIILLDAASGHVLAAAHPQTARLHAFPPGSLFKLVSAMALLDKARVDPESRVVCRDAFRVGSRILTCGYPGGHGKICLETALSRSCCIYFYAMGLKLCPENILEEARLLGLGKAPGRLVPPVNPEQTAGLLVGEGQNILATPMQMAGAVRRIAMAQGGVSGKSADIVKRGMRMCVSGGTGKKAASGVPFSVAGKTGTARDLRFPGRTLGWFGGFAPCPDPEVIILVFVEGGTGADSAAPLAAKALRAYFTGTGKAVPDRIWRDLTGKTEVNKKTE
jgi:penicillin-binding protein 2